MRRIYFLKMCRRRDNNEKDFIFESLFIGELFKVKICTILLLRCIWVMLVISYRFRAGYDITRLWSTCSGECNLSALTGDAFFVCLRNKELMHTNTIPSHRIQDPTYKCRHRRVLKATCGSIREGAAATELIIL